MGWPQYTWLALVAASWLINVSRHGMRAPDHNGWASTVNVLVGGILLYAGGFFTAN